MRFPRIPPEHKGYCSFDLSSRRVILSRHVIFDEAQFPYLPPQPARPPTADPPATENPTPIYSEIRLQPASGPKSPPGSVRIGSAPDSAGASTVPSPSMPTGDSTGSSSSGTAGPQPSPPPTTPSPPRQDPLPPRAVPIEPPANAHRMVTGKNKVI
jgi:hypothetical protein